MYAKVQAGYEKWLKENHPDESNSLRCDDSRGCNEQASSRGVLTIERKNKVYVVDGVPVEIRPRLARPVNWREEKKHRPKRGKHAKG